MLPPKTCSLSAATIRPDERARMSLWHSIRQKRIKQPPSRTTALLFRPPSAALLFRGLFDRTRAESWGAVPTFEISLKAAPPQRYRTALFSWSIVGFYLCVRARPRNRPGQVAARSRRSRHMILCLPRLSKVAVIGDVLPSLNPPLTQENKKRTMSLWCQGCIGRHQARRGADAPSPDTPDLLAPSV